MTEDVFAQAVISEGYKAHCLSANGLGWDYLRSAIWSAWGHQPRTANICIAG